MNREQIFIKQKCKEYNKAQVYFFSSFYFQKQFFLFIIDKNEKIKGKLILAAVILANICGICCSNTCHYV